MRLFIANGSILYFLPGVNHVSAIRNFNFDFTGFKQHCKNDPKQQDNFQKVSVQTLRHTGFRTLALESGNMPIERNSLFSNAPCLACVVLTPESLRMEANCVLKFHPVAIVIKVTRRVWGIGKWPYMVERDDQKPGMSQKTVLG